ncbi:MAG TPA: histidine kinase [Acidimicrobiia bacterium]|nr:histidine kinase [Acidimicrobiia bacterium]
MERLRRLRDAWRRVDRLWVDWLPVAALLLLSQIDPNVAESGVDSDVSPVLAGAFTVATVLPLGWRRRHPLAVIGAIAGAVMLWGLAVGPVVTFTSFLSMILAVYAVAAYGNLATAMVGAAVSALVVTVQALTDRQPGVANDWVYPLFYFGGAWLLGRAARRRDERNRTLRQLSLHLERENEDRGRLAAAEERARIARELHDVIAHGVGMMVVQAEAAEEILTTNPERAGRALQQIQTSGRQALTELRHLLGVLRRDTDDQPINPQPSLADLPTLVDQVTDIGLEVKLTIKGEERPLSAGVELSVYRIVQEALTNVRKHGQATSATVEIQYGSYQVEIQVTDNGTTTGAKAPPNGHGVIGMRERVASYGGTFKAGPVADGFSVRAVLPTEPAE